MLKSVGEEEGQERPFLILRSYSPLGIGTAGHGTEEPRSTSEECLRNLVARGEGVCVCVLGEEALLTRSDKTAHLH